MMATNDATRLFQINENDLAELERTLPRLLDHAYPLFTRRHWVRIRFACGASFVQEIVMNVRWNYGPPVDVEVEPV